MWDETIYLSDLLRNGPETFSARLGDTTWSHGELLERQARLEQLLADRGVGDLDRVMVRVSGDPQDIVAILAAVGARGIAVPVAADTPARRFETIADNCGAGVAISLVDGRHQVEELATGRKSDIAADLAFSSGRSSLEPCLLIYTSGSSGIPKGVVCSHQSVLSAVRSIQARLRYRGDDRVALPVPLTFDYGLYQTFLAMHAGASLVMYRPGSVGPKFVDALEQDAITVLPSLPDLTQTVVSICRRRQRQLPGLRLLTSTGADFSASLVEAAKTVLPHCRVLPMYGLTECKRAAIHTSSEPYRHSSGQPIPGTRIAIVDNGSAVAPGNEGEIWVTGPNVMSGYWPLDDEALNERFKTDRHGERWVATGDRGWLDDRGDLHVRGRMDDVFKRDGYRTSVAEIEESLLLINGIDKVCVVPPDGEARFVALYEGSVGVDRAKVLLGEQLEPYKIPEAIVKVASIPVTTNGKIDRSSVRRVVMEGKLFT